MMLSALYISWAEISFRLLNKYIYLGTRRQPLNEQKMCCFFSDAKQSFGKQHGYIEKLTITFFTQLNN